MTAANPTAERTPDEQFITRLAAMHHSRDRALTGLRTWEPGHVSPQQLVDVARATEGLDFGDYETRAAVGHLFAVWHAGKSGVTYGYPGTTIGNALRTLGSSGQGYGPRNPAVERILTSVVTATTFGDLLAALSHATKLLKPASAPPHWETLLTDIRAWRQPATRNLTRLAWSQAFYTSPPKKTAPQPSRTKAK